MTNPREEQVFFAETFYRRTFNLRGRILFWRFDGCTFVDCTILIDHATEQVSFTGCTFEDCNIDSIEPDAARCVVSKANIFERPLAVRKAEFDQRLAEVLSRRKRN